MCGFRILICTALLFCSSVAAFAKEMPATQNAELQKWAQKAATEVMTFSFANFDEHKEQNKSLFTERGYVEFYKAMDKAQIKKAVLENKLMLQTEVLCSPEIVSADLDKDFTLEFPIQTVWFDGSKARHDYMRVTMRVLKQENGSYGVEQWIAIPVTEEETSICSKRKYIEAQIGSLESEIKRQEERLQTLKAKLADLHDANRR